LNIRCSKKWALPDDSNVSSLDPDPMKHPTEEIGEGHVSVQTLIPLLRVVI